MESDVTHVESLLKLWAWFDANKKQVKMGAIIVAVLAVVIAFVVWQHSEKERKAGEALSDVFVPPLMTEASARTSGVEAYQKVAASYPGYDAGAEAMLLAAANLFAENKYKEAMAEFDRFTREHRDSAFMGQALLGRAACFDALNQTNDAVTAYKTLVDQHPTESMIPQAKFALARIYEAQGKVEQARNLYEEVGNNRYSSVGSEAGIRLEELYQKHPELMPAPTPAASSSAGASAAVAKALTAAMGANSNSIHASKPPAAAAAAPSTK